MDEESIFVAAIEQTSPAECAAFLERACGGDLHLRERVERLVAAHRRPDPFLDAPDTRLITNAAQNLVRESVGSTIGPYRLLEQIGEGGMGLVFMAEQQKPVRRVVALKIIKPGMDSRQVVRRFESERQALALMEHPHIAKVLDVGTTESGHPYFVMELVRGIAITDYCDQAKLSQRERLELFISVCHAVQHAHQKGIIHRDLKPANVLVTMHDDVAMPKVIDFGVAKAIDRTAADHTQVTNFAQMIGTPTYMSPEQAQMSCLDVDTRSDVYSLGVLLYELLTGTTPFEKQRLRDAGFIEVQRILREEEPPPPSSRIATLGADSLSTMAANRGVDVRRFSQIVRGDLDWIVMKALEKDRTRRYESASALAADVRRFLADEPVEARPPTAAYRLRKFARRNRTVVAFTSLLIGFLVISYVGLVVLNVLISDERSKFQQQRNLAQENEEKVQAREQTIRNFVYVADIQRAAKSYHRGDIDQARERLEQHRAGLDFTDERGFEWHFLRGLCEDRSQTWHGHSGAVFRLAYSADGSLLASASRDRTVVIWNVADGSPRTILKDFSDDVNSVAFSPDRRLLATAEEDRRVRVWDWAAGAEIARFTDFAKPAADVFFAADQKWLVTTELDWSTHQNGRITVWDLATQVKHAVVEGYRALAVHAASQRVVASDANGNLGMWSLPDLEPLSLSTFNAGQTFGGAFARDGERVATCGGNEHGIRVWLPDWSGHVQLASERRFVARSLDFTPDRRLLVCAQDDGTAQVWDVGNNLVQTHLRQAPCRLWGTAVSPDGESFAIGADDGSITVRQFVELPRARRRLIDWDDRRFSAVAAHLGHGLLAVVDQASPKFAVCNLETGGTLHVGSHPSIQEARSAAFSSDDRLIWIGDVSGAVHLVDRTDDTCLATRQLHTAAVDRISVSADGNLVATVSSDNTMKVWDGRSGNVLLERRKVDANHHMPAEFLDDRTLLSVKNEPEGDVVEAEDMKSRQVIKQVRLDSRVVAFALDKDRRILATSITDGSVRLWDFEAGRLLATLTGHRDTAHLVAFSPDGRTLASASPDREVKLWHVPTGQLLLDLRAGQVPVQLLMFSRNGRRLICGSDGHVFVWGD